AKAAGAITVEMCEPESECVSSKSRPWHVIAFANAAFAAGRRSARPITVACASPPSSRIVARPSVPLPVACPASPQPSTSRMWSLACSTTSTGTSSRSSEVAKPAIVSAAVMSHRPVVVGTGKRSLNFGCAALVDHERALELDHHLAPLVDATAAHRDDAHVRLVVRLTRVHALVI